MPPPTRTRPPRPDRDGSCGQPWRPAKTGLDWAFRLGPRRVPRLCSQHEAGTMHPRRHATAIVAAMVAVTGVGVSSAAALPTKQADPQPGGWVLPRAVPATGTFYPTTPFRLLGTADTGYAVEPASGATVAVSGRSGLPSSGISAVVVNVVAVA